MPFYKALLLLSSHPIKITGLSFHFRFIKLERCWQYSSSQTQYLSTTNSFPHALSAFFGHLKTPEMRGRRHLKTPEMVRTFRSQIEGWNYTPSSNTCRCRSIRHHPRPVDAGDERPTPEMGGRRRRCRRLQRRFGDVPIWRSGRWWLCFVFKGKAKGIRDARSAIICKRPGLMLESEGRTESDVNCSSSNARTTDRVRGLQSESESLGLQTAP